MGAALALLSALAGLVEDAPQIEAGIAAILNSTGKGVDPTPEQQAAIDLALDTAHARLQAAGKPIPVA